MTKEPTTTTATDYDDDDDYEEAEMCECELDWRCGLHQGLPTPEDLLATWWSANHP